MLLPLLAAAPVMFLCLALQAVVVAACLRRYARFRQRWLRSEPLWADILLLSAVMLLTLLCNFAQMAIWAVLFLLLGEFPDFAGALYHSAVNFATLGYGDIVMSGDWRVLGPIEAANGILMFGVSTAVMTAAVLDVVKYNKAHQEA
ncbi:potassium channel family protein [Cupriavidus taiwanensis]|uniref:potassium channel family protein n=1 Tax=Cupriavidus taiwanensis TaxID=164546 RepID=UPI000E19DB03|nr:potassium channel family protein [Cupriavidus taiwanensis]SOZ28598.1 putative membrane protein, ion channel [Cupriavidus taiwanensis]SPA33386.1 putative membrane protein, ion channel [Cupriavidus taiwanensis]SPA49029.1 putative membrane protein, ion channel [Cupriavidus taiwanensis]